MRILPAMFLVAGLATGCQKTISDFEILATSEAADPGDASKTRLVDEHLVYWEEDDTISFNQVGNTDNFQARFSAKGEGDDKDINAVFKVAKGIKVSLEGKYIALFPYNGNNILKDGDVQIVLKPEQGYRDDNSFARSACPMVAYGGFKDETDHVVRLLFHNLSGLVRIQVFNTAPGVPTVNLEKITITSNGTQKLSGTFNVNNYKEYAPCLSGGDGNTITITPSSPIAIPKEGLAFYVSLPATHGTRTVNYSEMNITIEANDGNGGKLRMQRGIKNIPVRRNGITYMPALNIDSWSQGSGSGSASSGISGCGTADRPFLLYSVEDLCKVRDICNSNTPVLNGVPLTGENSQYVRFKLMRSDITLDDINWTDNIHDFHCQLFYSANTNNSTPGITNNSSLPIIRNLHGSVLGLAVKGGFNKSPQDTAQYSPLCHTVEVTGSLMNCALSSSAEYVYTLGNLSIAGLCVYNKGTISGCGCRGKMGATKISGICYQNQRGGIIEKCYAASPMQATPPSSYQEVSAAGICFNNYGTVKECYMSANINKNRTRWGGIVYNNSGKVEQCYLDASGIIQSTVGVGGIVYKNEGANAEIDYCWSDADLIDVTNGGAGGVVHTMVSGEVRNCFRGRGMGGITCRGGATGGVVAYMQGGTIANSYCYGDMTQSTVSQKGTFAGSISGGEIVNCYGISCIGIDNIVGFYGIKSGGTITDCYSNIANTDNGVYSVSNADLLTYLNGWHPSTAETYRKWVAASGSKPPILSQKKEWLTTSK
ncbi:MAG: hypothetical protein J6X88_11665 [Bacteroidales bacterium]|nr:hypothetical protein [Bacteroidales bacterium]